MSAIAPVSGFSISPARTFGSAFVANIWTSIWIYFIAPLLGMSASAELYVRITNPHPGRHRYFHHRHLTRRPEVETSLKATVKADRQFD